VVGCLIVTGHNEENTEEVSAEAQRKREQRARDEAAGIVEIDIRLGPVEQAMLREGQEVRGGLSGPYSRNEYIATLIRRDHELLQQQRKALEGRICENCRKPLPRGCGGVWGRELACAVSQAGRALEL
jgi:hypothetical protein